MSHDSSEIILIYWLGAQETFIIIIIIINAELLCFLIFLWKLWNIFYHQLFEIEIFCNIINVFSVIFINWMRP